MTLGYEHFQSRPDQNPSSSGQSEQGFGELLLQLEQDD